MPKKILVVDDEPGLCALLKNRLMASQYDVVLAHNGLEAYDRIRREKPDLVILDVLMPMMTGYELFQKLKADAEVWGKIPVIVMSARPDMKHFFDPWNIAAFIGKPFDPQHLLSKVEEVLSARQTAAPPPANQPGAAPRTGGGKKFLVAGKHSYMVKKIKEFLEERGASVLTEIYDTYAVQTAKSDVFDAILCQYWENPEVFNTRQIFNSVQAVPHLNRTLFVIFCLQALEIDVVQEFKGVPVVSYVESSDLRSGLMKLLEEKAVF
ncbi:MAG: response regulator [Candidatus Omnitrophica bacterium]|nr:response regulator [Candidatus Omnitrophota bacterium]